MPEPNVTGPAWSLNLPGIVDCREIYRGRARQANLDGVPQYVRVFLVRTDVINPKLTYVAAAPGIAWRDPHPDDPNAVLVESSSQQDGDSPFHYKVTYSYKYLDETEKLPWNRPAQYTFSGSLASSPAFWCFTEEDTNNTQKQIIINTAGDPLQGLDRDEAEFSVSIQQNVKPPFNFGRAQQYVGAINSDVWSGGQPKTWKVQSISSSRKFESIPADTPDAPPVKVYYWDMSTTIAYRQSGWDLQTWDVGFNEIKNGKRVKIYAGSEPVSEPVALSNGLAKTPGQPPDLLSFRIYPMRPFTNIFPPIPDQQFSGYPYS